MRKILMSVVCTLVLALVYVGQSGLFETMANAAEQAATAETEESGVWDTYSDTWALTDELGRSAADYAQAGAVSGNKKVGIFYSVWHSSIMEVTCRSDDGAPRNLSQIIRNNPDTWDTDAGLYGPQSSYHYWAEPLYGYYDLSKDDYVVRTHATLLSDAGVDYILCDLTNFYAGGSFSETESCEATLKNICKVYKQMRTEGLDTPDIALLFTWQPINAGQAMNWCWDNIIKDNLDLFFNYDGKPVMFGSGDYARSDVKSACNFRSVAANYDATNSYQWLSIYPQSTASDVTGQQAVMTVGVAQNWTNELDMFTSVDDYGRFNSRGRSWTSESSRLLSNPLSEEYNSEYGYNFQEQFNRALDIDPDMLIVTGWNEWIAARFYESLYSGKYSNDLPNYAQFCDGFTTEFSRDIEMTREGGLNDNFYNQLVENIRSYKGVRNNPDYTNRATIAKGDFSGWENIPSYYRDTLYDAVNRNAQGIGNNYYLNETGINDIVLSKVARDDENVYFYVETEEDIKGFGSDHCMRLYIKTTGANGWNGYNYMINGTAPVLGRNSVEKFNGSWDNRTTSGTAMIYVSGNKMSVSVKLSDLGLSSDNVAFEFKWHDNAQNDGDVLDFYLSGDAAPNARFNYVYHEKGESISLSGRVNLYSDNQDVQSMQAEEDDVIAMRFTANCDFKGIDICAYNLLNAKAEYTLKLYKYQGNYAQTVIAEPLLTAAYTNAYDRTSLYIGAKVLSGGEYIVTISNVKSDAENFAGVYFYEKQTAGGVYLNGAYSSSMMLKSRIYYCAYKESTAETDEKLLDGNSATVVNKSALNDYFKIFDMMLI